MDYIFEGIGTEIFSLIIGACLGGTAGYKLGSKSKQKQKGCNNSNQIQNSINVGNNIVVGEKLEVGSARENEKG